MDQQNKRNHVISSRQFKIALFVAAIVFIFGITWLSVRAAGFFTAVETEAGTLATNATKVADTAASGGQAVQFNAPATSPPTSGGSGKFGMSAPPAQWSLRLSEVGGPTHIKFRRLFNTNITGNYKLVREAINAGMIPIISFKVSPYTWAEVASGAADTELRAIVTNLDAIPGEKFVALHHEPAKDGTAKDWSDMQIHALPILKTAKNVKVGVIANGWWWSSKANGYTDAEIAQWITPQVIAVSDVIAADTYQDTKLIESGGPKIKNLGAWARRVGGVKALGIGEFNGLNAAGITEAMNAVKAEPLMQWACVWNSDGGDGDVGTVLTGDRLEAFKAGLATSDPT